MIWFALAGIIFSILGIIFLTSFRWESDLGARICGFFAVVLVVVLVCNANYTGSPKDGLEAQEVYEVTEDGVLRKSNTTYYQDENGDWYIQSLENGWEWKMWVQPFYEIDYKKVDAPIFKNGTFVANNAEDNVQEDVRKYCTGCGAGVDETDKFCSECGTKVKK